MKPEDIVRLAAIGVAIFLAWNLWRGRAIIPLYYIAVLVLGSLAASLIAQIENLTLAIEPANVAAIAFALTGCSGGGALWEQEMGRDLEGSRVYAPFTASDLLSWRGILKAVDRIGAGPTVLIYLVVFGAAIAGVALTVHPAGPAFDRTALVLSLAPTGLFAILSAWYIFRGVRRLVPGA